MVKIYLIFSRCIDNIFMYSQQLQSCRTAGWLDADGQKLPPTDRKPPFSLPIPSSHFLASDWKSDTMSSSPADVPPEEAGVDAVATPPPEDQVEPASQPNDESGKEAPGSKPEKKRRGASTCGDVLH